MRSAHYAPDYMPLEGSNGAPSSKDPNAVITGTGSLQEAKSVQLYPPKLSFLSCRPAMQALYHRAMSYGGMSMQCCQHASSLA